MNLIMNIYRFLVVAEYQALVLHKEGVVAIDDSIYYKLLGKKLGTPQDK